MAAVFCYGVHFKVQSLILILVYDDVGSGANVFTIDAKAGLKTQKDCTKGQKFLLGTGPGIPGERILSV